MSELHQALLDMLLAFDRYCASRGLRYTLFAGTLLGAVRHKGFIPWDDDVDLGMPRPDYDRLATLADDFAAETGYCLRGNQGVPLSIAPLIKVVDKRILVKPEREVAKSYLWIDINPVDAMPDDPKDVAKLCAKAHRYHALLNFLASTPQSGRTPARRAIKWVASPLRHIPALKWEASRELTNLAKALPWGSTNHVGGVAWGLANERERVDAATFSEYVRLSFEGHELSVMGCWEQYLRGIYNKYYMILPPVSKRVTHLAGAWWSETGEPITLPVLDTKPKRVLTYGTFDLFHEGHANLLRRARALGDELIVGVTSPIYDAERGKLDVVQPLEERMEAVRASGYADEVIVEDHKGQKVEDIEALRPDLLVFGSDWEGKFDYLKRFCDVTYLPRTEGISSRTVRESNYGMVRLGIVGSGRVTRAFVPEVQQVHGIEVTGVWSRTLSSAQKLASSFDIPFATDDLDELLAKVDAVYVATPHETHHDLALLALQAGKHVLCEKPMALAEADARELVACAQERGLVLMEAVKTAYSPGYQRLVQAVRDGAIGQVVDVEACFTRLTPHGLRERDDARYGGAFLEFGSYGLLPVLDLLGPDALDSVRFDLKLDERGIDLYTKASFASGSGFGLVKCGIGAKSDGHLVVAGTEGYILVPAPWWKPSRFEIHREDPNDVTVVESSWQGAGTRYEIGSFVQAIWVKDPSHARFSADDSIAFARVFERFMAQREADK